MKARGQCYECLARLVRQAATLASEDRRLQAAAVREGLRALDESFSTDELTIVISTRLHEVVRTVTGNPDPYRSIKEKEMAVAREILGSDADGRCVSLAEGIRLAVLGNVIDFFKPVEQIVKELKQPVRFAIDDTSAFAAKLKEARKVLFLADNAGEVYFDLPLLGRMRQTARVIYVVKPSPVQDDITMEDIDRSGVTSCIGEVMTIGVASPGVIFAQASQEFRRAFETADLILAKGMGYYEALSELSPQQRVLHCLVAKCEPVARSLRVPLGSFVAALI